jgi:lycopene cyclase domain-containing protein
MPVYLYLLAGSVLVPGLFSIFFIDPIKKWKHFLISTSIVAGVFLIWDAIFTSNGVWGFNPDYCIGFDILKMPIEEWLFFFIIPFCSLFIHYAIQYQFPGFGLPVRIAKAITLLAILSVAILLFLNFGKAYTTVNYVILIPLFIWGFLNRAEMLAQFYPAFLVILIPFFVVNGVLTGTGVEEPIVWYNNEENMGFRLWTVPLEDIGYAFTMLFGNLVIFEYLKERWKSK